MDVCVCGFVGGGWGVVALRNFVCAFQKALHGEIFSPTRNV